MLLSFYKFSSCMYSINICYLHEMPWFQCCSLIIVTISAALRRPVEAWTRDSRANDFMQRRNTRKKCHEKIVITAFHFVYIHTFPLHWC